MTLDYFKSFRQWIARHKAVAVGSLCVIGSTALWAAVDFPRVNGGSRSERRARSTATDSAPSAIMHRPHNAADKVTLDDALALGRKSLVALKSVADYTARFEKTELINGRLVNQTMDIKCRRQPFSVYLGCHRRGGKGREVIYVAGSNDDDLIVHEAGLKAMIGTLKLKPESPAAMEANRHPITDVGLVRLIELAMVHWKNEQRVADPAQVDVQIFHDVQLGTAVCDEVQITHHENRPEIGYQIGRVFFDKQTEFPIQGELWGWPEKSGSDDSADDAPLLEKYTYTEIKTNVGLTARDFDPQNSEYHFVSR